MSEKEAKDNDSRTKHEANCFCMGAGPEMFSLFKKLGPDSARRHFRSARIEMLKGMRVMIDKRIEELEEPVADHGTKVTVE